MLHLLVDSAGTKKQENSSIIFCTLIEMDYLCTAFPVTGTVAAQMAESVDALVSNTSGATRAGSTPALGTNELAKYLKINT